MSPSNTNFSTISSSRMLDHRKPHAVFHDFTSGFRLFRRSHSNACHQRNKTLTTKIRNRVGNIKRATNLIRLSELAILSWDCTCRLSRGHEVRDNHAASARQLRLSPWPARGDVFCRIPLHHCNCLPTLQEPSDNAPALPPKTPYSCWLP